MVSGNNGIENIKSNDIIPYRMTNTKLIYYIHIICISNTIYIYITYCDLTIRTHSYFK